MYVIYSVTCVLVILVNFVNAQSCDTPNNLFGRCVMIHQCESLLALVQRNNLTVQDIRFLRKSQCGMEGNIPKLCCPLENDCETPEGRPGRCVGLYDCQHITDALNNAKSPESVSYIRNYVCKGPEKYSVCCNRPLLSQPETASSSAFRAPEPVITTTEPQPEVTSVQPKPETTTTPQPKPETVTPQQETDILSTTKQTGLITPPPGLAEWLATRPNRPRIKFNRHQACANAVNAFPPERYSKCCGIDVSSGNKIVGGTATNVEQYPWLVVIEYVRVEEITLSCGGALISGKYVLTAGHCVAGRILELGTPRNVRLGEYNTTDNGRDCIQVAGGGMACTEPVVIAPIEKTIPHPDFEKNPSQRRHDIALIRLRIVAPYTDFIRPICLPTKDYTLAPPENFPLWVAGWGRYVEFANGSGLASPVKLHLQVSFVETNECQSIISSLSARSDLVLMKGQFCARGDIGKDSCKGDSGGPLMYADVKSFEAIGIVSFGPDRCGKTVSPAIYTDVYNYLPWIKSNIEA